MPDADPGRLVLNVRGGARLAVPPTLLQVSSYIILEQEDWFEDEIRFVRGWLRPGMSAVDVGACYGIYTVTMARAVGSAGRVWSFEPVPQTAEYLRFNVELNRLAHVQLRSAAVTHRDGRVAFRFGTDPEINSIVATGDDAGATGEVEAVTLDRMAAELGWRDVDFVKLDVEGHELEAVEGGVDFLQRHSPLIMLEIRSPAGLDLRALDRLAAMGYRAYRLLPGPLVLVPFEGRWSDAFQMNLFVCKSDRAEALAAAGVLARDPHAGPAPQPSAWASYAAAAPYAHDLSARWPSSAAASARAGAHDYFAGLAAFAQAKADGESPDRQVYCLNRALQCVRAALGAADTLARRMTFARLAWELGARTEAVAALKHAAHVVLRDAAPASEEPFLATSPRYEGVPAQGDAASWRRCAVLEQYERLRHYSSCFAPEESLANIEPIAGLAERSAEMERRRQLVGIISGAQEAFQPTPGLAVGSEENLNPEFWSRGLALAADPDNRQT